MSIKMIFSYTLLLNGVIFIWYGVEIEQNQFSFNAPVAEEIVSDGVPILLLKEVDKEVLLSKDS
jgi:hypothetical protein